mmetsp:Transcript_1847/g.4346  ORF Transcript_1847/g.4346 Transcript_1847/m.4346 type:complete len:88 (-) Transcript_1847:43-306(-)
MSGAQLGPDDEGLMDQILREATSSDDDGPPRGMTRSDTEARLEAAIAEYGTAGVTAEGMPELPPLPAWVTRRIENLNASTAPSGKAT